MSKRANRNFKKRKEGQKEIRENFLASEGRPYSKSFDLEASPLDGSIDDWFEEATQSCGRHRKAMKGAKGQNCNVTACQLPGAVFQNVGMISTGSSWYCRSCATDIHMVNTRDVENGCGFTLFPEFQRVLERYKETRRAGKDPHDIENYSDINQNPWGSCYHFDRDKYLEKQNDNSNRDAGEA